jgi:hypothetical protein
MADQTSGTVKAVSSFTRTGKLQVRLSENIQLDALQNIVARIAGMTGCTHCGLLGIDLNFIGGDPAVTDIAKLPGVTGASFQAE